MPQVGTAVALLEWITPLIKEGLFMVSKFKTVGKTAAEFSLMLAVAVSLLVASGFSAQSFAQDDKNISVNSSSPADPLKQDEFCLRSHKDNPKGLAACRKKIEDSFSSGGAKEGCEKDWDDLDKALETAQKSCSAAGIGNGGQKGFPACAGGMDLCSCVETPENPKCPTDEAAEETESIRPPSDGGSGVDLNKERFNSKFCPAMSKADLKEFKEEVTASQEKVDELEGKIPDLQDSINTAQSDLSAKLSELEEQKRVAQTEYNNSKKELERGQKDNISALEQKIAGIQDQIFKAEGDIRTALLSKSEVGLKRDESIKAINLSCHSAATQEASAKRLETFKLIKAGTYVRGGFLSALKRVGLSDRKEDQQYADRLYKNCLASKQTKDAIDSANKMAELALNQIDGNIVALQQQVAQLKDSITKVKNQEGGCAATGPTGQDSSEMCRILNEYQQDRIQLDQEALQNATKIGNDVIRAQQEAARSMQTKQEALAKAQEQLAREQAYLADKKEALSLKLQASGASGATGDKVGAVMGDLGSLEAVIRRIRMTGCCSDQGEAGAPAKEKRCDEINGYIAAYDHADPDVETSLDQNASDVDPASDTDPNLLANPAVPVKTEPRDGTPPNPNAKKPVTAPAPDAGAVIDAKPPTATSP